MASACYIRSQEEKCRESPLLDAIVMDPGLLLADEPTGNLDTATSDQVMDIFSGAKQEWQHRSVGYT